MKNKHNNYTVHLPAGIASGEIPLNFYCNVCLLAYSAPCILEYVADGFAVASFSGTVMNANYRKEGGMVNID